MAFDNGSGNGGGNGSIRWDMMHGSEKSGYRRPALANRLKPATLGPAGLRSSVSDAATRAKLGDQDVELEAPEGPPGPAEVKLGLRVEGHDETPFEEIGKPDHPGCFRVRLRFRDTDLDELRRKSPATHAMVKQHGKRDESLDPNSLFLEIDVPAIKREPPVRSNEWPDMPWEIHWGW